MRDKLGWDPWAGPEPSKPGQAEIIEAYRDTVFKQIERRDLRNGVITEEQLKYYTPGERIQYVIRLPKAYNTGGTKVAAGLVNHFFDCFSPVVIYTFAPTWPQVKDLLWKEILSDRSGQDLPGKQLHGALRLELSANHFAQGRATNNMNQSGMERIQGQHSAFNMYVLDEAEGVEDFVYDAVDKMASGGVRVVIMLGNPRSRSSKFYKYRTKGVCQTIRMGSLYHPNVTENREVIPGAVRRDWIDEKINDGCRIVSEHDEDENTFEVSWRPGQIFKPDRDFLYGVLAIAPRGAGTKNYVSVGAYESAVARAQEIQAELSAAGQAGMLWAGRPGSGFDWRRAYIGVDVARFGDDYGTIYFNWQGQVRRYEQLDSQNTHAYTGALEDLMDWLHQGGVRHVSVRLDGTAGYAAGIVDALNSNIDLERKFETIQVLEIHFGSAARQRKTYDNIITQLYAEAGESLKGLALFDPPPALESDLTEREYEYVNRKGRTVERLEKKEKFRKKHNRSPDDGDGFVLAVAPEHLFGMMDGKSKKARVGAER